ncbi:MAG: hypothetical protein KC877_01820 [Candidatus Kaiserbacteria bacterium]|nr:hypothetical protein [Candidatus Kaiserbacteria bacterium]MCB9815912.1 hypothetical protein [Candidatus Nomurabacteria bacterium]
MQLFGLLSLIIVIAIIGWWMSTGLVQVPATAPSAEDRSSSFYVIPPDPESSPVPTYGDALDAARGAADAMER